MSCPLLFLYFHASINYYEKIKQEKIYKYRGSFGCCHCSIVYASCTEQKGKKLVHHVFFWLKNPGSTADRDKLVTGLKSLAKIETINEIHIGVLASTEKT
jgi:hypothetical protein